MINDIKMGRWWLRFVLLSFINGDKYVKISAHGEKAVIGVFNLLTNKYLESKEVQVALNKLTDTLYNSAETVADRDYLLHLAQGGTVIYKAGDEISEGITKCLLRALGDSYGY